MAEAPAGFDIRRILLLAGVIVVILFSILFFLFRGCAPSGRGDTGYTVIYSNLDLRDAANVIARLKEIAIPYEIREDGRAIAVPKAKADDARLGLAEKNLPLGGVVGYEIFDVSKLGATDFDRRIQLIRAISGELSRTIRRIEGVEDARVQVVLPETRLFAASVAPVTASVLLRLKLGVELSPAKVNGIIHLVASSVENLQTENVTVVDDTGRILTAKGGTVEVASYLPPPMVTRSQEIPQTLSSESAETTVLTKVKGLITVASPEVPAVIITTQASLQAEDKMILRVRAKKEYERNLAGKAQEILNRFYPPNTVIVKVNADLEDFDRTEQINAKKLTAIVLVDNRVEIAKSLKESTMQAVAAAIGYNSKRGDRIIMQRVPFRLATEMPEIGKEVVTTVAPEAGQKKLEIQFGWLKNLALYVAGILLLLFIVLLIWRRRRKSAVTEMAGPETEQAYERETKSSTVAALKTMAERNPERIAELLRQWLTE